MSFYTEYMNLEDIPTQFKKNMNHSNNDSLYNSKNVDKNKSTENNNTNLNKKIFEYNTDKENNEDFVMMLFILCILFEDL